MNTVITATNAFGEKKFNLNDELVDIVISSLIQNNTFVPNIERVVFNTKTKDEVTKKDGDGNPVLDGNGRVVKETVELVSPILTTVVYFKDGTKSTVKNSDKDAITLVNEKVKLSDGTETTVWTASEESREVGLAYAILKRIVCGYDDGGNVRGSGFAKFLKGVVGNAMRQDVDSAKTAAEKRISRARAAAKKANLQPKAEKKPKKPSFVSVLNKLDAFLSKMMKEKDGSTDENAGENAGE